MKFRVFLLFFFLWTGYSGLAQEILVLDQEGRQALSGVDILDKKSKLSSRTNAEGKANLSVFTEKNQSRFPKQDSKVKPSLGKNLVPWIL
jgi:hypothetical protein